MREIVPSFAVEGSAMIGLPPARARGAADEVHLAAEARVDRAAHRVGADLAGEVHGDRRVDRHHLVVLRDHERVVDVVARVELDEGVVVEEVERPLRAEHERRDDLALVQRLGLAGDDARSRTAPPRRPRTSRCGSRGPASRRGRAAPRPGSRRSPSAAWSRSRSGRRRCCPIARATSPTSVALRQLDHRPVDLDHVGEARDVDEASRRASAASAG